MRTEPEYLELVDEFRQNPMLAREFVDHYESFSPWQKFLIAARYSFFKIFGI